MANSISTGDLMVEINVESDNELGQLQSSMKNMIDKLKEVVGTELYNKVANVFIPWVEDLADEAIEAGKEKAGELVDDAIEVGEDSLKNQ